MLALLLALQVSVPSVTYAAKAGTITAGGLYSFPASGVDTIRVTVGGLTKAIPVRVAAGSPSVGGIPFGPFGLWSSCSTVAWGPAPFSAAIGASQPSCIVQQIAAARTMGQRLVLFLAGGDHEPYKTDGKFDPAKWRARVALYNTPAIRTAIAEAVADGTVLGTALVDEPENKDWGWAGTTSNTSYITKATLDSLAGYAKQFFPTLPMGVNHGSNQQGWRATERFAVVDYVNYQYRSDAGDPATYRTKVLAQSALDGVATSFSLNLLAGGTPDRDGVYDCAGTGQYGLGVWAPLCRMTPSQVTTFGTALAAGCALLLWRYDATLFGDAPIQQALLNLAATAATRARPSCRRP